VEKRLFRVWVDETGDRGSSAQSSPFFGVAAVVLADGAMPVLRATKMEINKRLQRAAGHELHWSQTLKTHDYRAVAVEEVARLKKLARVTYVAVQKSSIPTDAFIRRNREALYNYPLRFLLERVSWLVDEQGGIARITLASVSGLPKRIPLDYIDWLRDTQDTQIRWQAIDPKVEVHQAVERDGLQIADIAAGALDRAIRPATSPPHRMEPAYLRELAPLIYNRGVGKIASYGLKALPVNLWDQFAWWPEFRSLPKNA
jgi:hypothetical protein